MPRSCRACSSSKGRLGESAETLQAALDAIFGAAKELGRVSAYASQLADEDTRDTRHQAMQQEVTRLGSSFGAEAAYAEPEILRIDRQKVASFLKERPGLKVYAHYLDDILRRQPHTGSEAEERLIAESSLMAPAASDIYGTFFDADFPYPTVTLSDGKTVKLDSSAFNLYRALPDRDDRRKVMSAFFGALGDYRRTFGATMNANVQKDVFYMKARKYASTLEAALDANNIPMSVYTRLVDGVNAHLPDLPPLPGAAQEDDGRGRSCTTTTCTRRSWRPSNLDYPVEEARAGDRRRAGAARPRLHRR